ncbi:MAG: hypothetical protein JSR77_12920 [Planctomycetes bacterium]|nr:hypothetical protein [Planctomycetota bacterium]
MLQRTRRTLTTSPLAARRTLAGAVALLVLALLPATSHGAERKVASGGAARPAPNTSPTDFHIQIKSDTPMTWFGQPRLWQNLVDLGPPAQQDPGPARTLDLEWSPIQGSPGDNFEWVLEFTQREYNKYDIKTWFTPRQSPTDWPQLGWEVDAGGNVTLRNSMPSAIRFSDLLFQFPSAMETTDLLALIRATPYGTQGLMTSGVVPAAVGDIPGELFVGQFNMQPGEYLTARADTVFADASFSPIESTVVLGHEAYPPAPGSVVALMIGCAGVMRRRRA